MYREISDKLIAWKDDGRRKPLLLTGVRQCGKTYILKQFGEEYFDNLFYVNFESSNKYADIFEYDYDVDRIIRELEIAESKKVECGRTLVIFDEIQECPRAITSLKYFCENKGNLHLIGAGSLLGVALKQDNISFPVGKVNRMQMRPMNFREFVIASGKENLLSLLEKWPTDRMIPDLYFVPLKKLLKEYYIVGGMPEAVSQWIASNDYARVDKIQDEILKDYADDFSKHAPVSELEKIRMIWDSIPIQLAKENNKFVFSHVKKGKRAHELEGALEWLKNAGLITKLELVNEAAIPLTANADKTFFKVYMSDIGLLRKRSGIHYDVILSEDKILDSYKGALTENYVLNELISLFDDSIYFWRSGNTAELDFLVESHSKILPIEVKAAQNTRAKSYRLFCKKYNPENGYKFSMKNIAVNDCEGTITYSIPLFMIWAMPYICRWIE